MEGGCEEGTEEDKEKESRAKGRRAIENGVKREEGGEGRMEEMKKDKRKRTRG